MQRRALIMFRLNFINTYQLSYCVVLLFLNYVKTYYIIVYLYSIKITESDYTLI